jgi:2-polyprenyl-3-methyl-5-hydroxy-6-metoxy-1,4-benzoquinol methylase
LDYGCGHNPVTLTIASNLGYQTRGVEFSQDVVDRTKLLRSGSIITVQEFQTTQDEFDIIFLGDILEHLINPIDELVRLKSRLSHHGFLIAQGPLQGLRTISHLMIGLNEKLKRNTPTESPPYHVSLAHKTSMERLFIEAGFQLEKLLIKEVQWPAPSLSDFLLRPTFRDLLQILAKSVDRAISKLVPLYGSHYFMVVTHS